MADTYAQMLTAGPPAKKSKKGGHTCDICGKTFSRRGNLNRHYNVHSQEKKHECKICGKRFREKHHVRSHMQVHEQNRAVGCEHCRRKFTDIDEYKRHAAECSSGQPVPEGPRMPKPRAYKSKAAPVSGQHVVLTQAPIMAHPHHVIGMRVCVCVCVCSLCNIA
jgi:hypothetical protein